MRRIKNMKSTFAQSITNFIGKKHMTIGIQRVEFETVSAIPATPGGIEVTSIACSVSNPVWIRDVAFGKFIDDAVTSVPSAFGRIMLPWWEPVAVTVADLFWMIDVAIGIILNSRAKRQNMVLAILATIEGQQKSRHKD